MREGVKQQDRPANRVKLGARIQIAETIVDGVSQWTADYRANKTRAEIHAAAALVGAV